jgi:predicted metalloprotease with PDZ domain
MIHRHVLSILAVAGLALMATGTSNAGTDCGRAAAEDHPGCLDPIERSQGRGWLGIEKQIREDGTYAVTSVVPESPASLAGLRAGDVIDRIDGVRLSPATAKQQLPSRSMIGRIVPLGVRRGGDRLILFARILESPRAVVESMRGQDRKRPAAN